MKREELKNLGIEDDKIELENIIEKEQNEENEQKEQNIIDDVKIYEDVIKDVKIVLLF